MCDPVTIALMAAAGGLQGIQAANEANKASKANRRNSIEAMREAADAESVRFQEESRAASQEAYDLALQGRAAEATFLNQAVESGVVGTSVNEGLYATMNTTATNAQRYAQEQDSRELGLTLNLKGLEAQATNRINSVPGMSRGAAFLQGATMGAFQGASASAGPAKGQKKTTE